MASLLNRILEILPTEQEARERSRRVASNSAAVVVRSAPPERPTAFASPIKYQGLTSILPLSPVSPFAWIMAIRVERTRSTAPLGGSIRLLEPSEPHELRPNFRSLSPSS